MTVKRGRPTAAERASRRLRVARAVAQLLVAEGWDAVTFDRLAAETRVAKRTLYADFGDRAGLVRAAMQRLHGTLDDPPRPERLEDAARDLVAQLLSDEAVGVHRAVIAAAARDPELAAEFYAAGPAQAQERLAALLPEAAVPPDAPAPPAERAAILFAALLGEPHRRRLLGLDPAPHDAAVAAHVDRVLAAFTPRAADPPSPHAPPPRARSSRSSDPADAAATR
ncbi:TetR/AcrR family transcriptional regulator [Leucobacter allii]|uniref:TetR/AcrR family transcriptional regulator n=1 Tax=Leucobacter allii TaxID=2932247 RepID=UPI001FCFF293|nr:TetR/AcrR family transcriptional regulator C-terminal domain-containing protein [Leucobacter allii]UOR01412.1 TetR/AcrR family transcriptional regulator [Leucobacter allii]